MENFKQKEEMQKQQEVNIEGKDPITIDCTNPKGGAIPKLGTKEFNNSAMEMFGGKPKQQTLDEAAERLYPDCSNVLRQMAKETFIEGAKWQQERSYSEEEVLNIIDNYNETFKVDLILREDFNQWFEQFKTK